MAIYAAPLAAARAAALTPRRVVGSAQQRGAQPLRSGRGCRPVADSGAGAGGVDTAPATALQGGRRAALLASAALVLAPADAARAIGFKKELKKKKIPAEDYTPLDDQLRIYELVQGSGEPIKASDVVTVHYDCYFRGIDVVSSRSARLLGGNRTIAEPIDVVAGGSLPRVSNKATFDERAGGLFTAGGGPKPPPALTNAVLGMKVGGKRSILVPAELAYGAKGELEIPPNTDIELQVEVLEKKSSK
mmetsp:Transcript_13403/g.33818  ORF Transcript_13403/g.33818 Transcript_13403/m.33818 type:complete len:247 (+) Transcript_13403:95-835(+)|eukprot:jgi/Tetstr1/466397/TSEL_010926.t1